MTVLCTSLVLLVAVLVITTITYLYDLAIKHKKVLFEMNISVLQGPKGHFQTGKLDKYSVKTESRCRCM